MKKTTIFFAATLFGFSTLAAHAGTLKDSPVHASLTFGNAFNEWTPILDTVGSGKEFFFDDGLATYTANFNASGLTVRVNCDKKAAKCAADPAFEMTFRDPLFDNATFDLVSNSLGVTDSVNGKKLTIDFAGGEPGTGNATAVFTIVPAPEPSSIVLLGTGLLGFAGALRRRFRA